jgi:hypothetical protein
MFSARVGRLIAGKVVYAVSCLLAAVLVIVAGFAHKTVAAIDSVGDGITIGGSSSIGEMNILVMGLESRTNFQGQCLSESLLVAMHAGSVASCENQTVGAEGGRLLDPPRRPGHLPQGVLRRHHHREDRPGLLLRLRHLA